jgi:hypothetical protein
VRATEFWVRGMTEDHIVVCMPKWVKKWPGRGTDNNMYEKKIKASHATIERNTIKRTKIVAFALIKSVIDKQEFMNLLKAGNEDDVIAYIAGQLQLEDINYIFSDAWKAIDFKFGRS